MTAERIWMKETPKNGFMPAIVFFTALAPLFVFQKSCFLRRDNRIAANEGSLKRTRFALKIIPVPICFCLGFVVGDFFFFFFLFLEISFGCIRTVFTWILEISCSVSPLLPIFWAIFDAGFPYLLPKNKNPLAPFFPPKPYVTNTAFVFFFIFIFFCPLLQSRGAALSTILLAVVWQSQIYLMCSSCGVSCTF